ncbi:helix-turn-helix domain-containing protein [Mycolicibacterium goodii]|uniref:GlxA family transcriptional regulator n=1 Tax=Mycolicibacterium goodii TaxID=134601 RepID=UPI001BDCC3C1|nr:helix-turn-helix domain-containing protein [Mycolicibacterium goodii]MBU8819852.1 helix-turn-helix domain-containing protein [Mycolicibacterium goodii]
MHTVAVLAVSDTIAFDLSTAVETFGRAQSASGEPAYRVMVCSAEPVVQAGTFRIASDHGLSDLAQADTIVVPGRHDVTGEVPAEVFAALRDAYARGTRIASICTGAFLLAAARLLDGRRATTHWVAADEFRTAFPAVDLDPDVLYVDSGQILTSAGASAGIDLCLHMIRLDHGAAVAADAARMAVAPLHRDGGQAQFIRRNTLAARRLGERTELDDVLLWIEDEAHRELTLSDIAARAAVSVRTLNRRFQAETGQTPMQWLTGVRIRNAQHLLESTADGIESIGRHVGFSSPANFREQFRKLTGVSPQQYRNSFRDRMAG